MAWSISPPLSKTLFSLNSEPLLPSSSSPRRHLTSTATITGNSYLPNHQLKHNKKTSYTPKPLFLLHNPSFTRHICRATEYEFPDPIPEFADAETEKFKTHLSKKLSKKDVCGDSVEEVVGICTEIFSTFMHSEYGGPGTLLVIPFIDMADTINERGLPGGPQAARAAVKWAQDHVDKDWNEWTEDSSS